MRGLRPIRSFAAAALMLAGLVASPTVAHAGTADRQPPPNARRVCERPADPDRASCAAWQRTDLPTIPFLPPHARPPGLSPFDIRSAYELFGRHAEGRTVAITVAFHNPNLESDLAVYRRQFHLPPCTKANGCLRVINQTGGTTPPAGPNPEWSLESSLDVDAVSAACPDCHILVVETDDDLFLNLRAGVFQAAIEGAKFVSSSWFIPEFADESIIDTDIFSLFPGIAFTFASGDVGGVPVYPSASPYVTSAGGTTLTRARNRRGWRESAWSGTGCGCSAFEAKPAFQHDTICPASRTTADISAVADPATGLAVYDTVPNPGGGTGWQVVGGTSLSSPLIAAMYALAGNPTPNSRPVTYPYAHPHAFHDITTGSAGAFPALVGYDAPTGFGTPDGVRGLKAP
jgi:subtilase family serine protease